MYNRSLAQEEHPLASLAQSLTHYDSPTTLTHLSNLLQTTPIIPLSNTNNSYSLIETAHYNKLSSQIEILQKKYQDFEEIAYQHQLANVKLNTEVNFKVEENLELSQNVELLVGRIKELEDVLVDNQGVIGRMGKEIEEIKRKNQEDMIQGQSRIVTKILLPETIKVEKSCQTQYELKKIQFIHLEQVQPQQKIIESSSKPSQQHFLTKFDAHLETITAEFNSQLSKMKQYYQKSKDFEQENQKLRRQNQMLKQRVKEVDVNQQKLKIWKGDVLNFIGKVQGKILVQNDGKEEILETRTKRIKDQQDFDKEDYEEEFTKLKSKIRKLEIKNIEIKNKFRNIDKIMQGDIQIGDDGAVNQMVKMSQRIKAVVRGIMVDI